MLKPTSLKYAGLTLAAGLISVAGTASGDQVILDDLIVDGSLCVGQDCVNGESFGFDTIRLKENNLRIKFQDTSSSASFPTNDWQITANDSSNGGANKFSIDDIDGARTPFTIEAGAPTSTLYVDSGGRIGIGTDAPVGDVHVVSGNTPTVRLQQDGSSGFTAQTWDLAGNEANFFVRDSTNGSTLPFRVYPGAPSNALTIEGSTGDIGIGTTSPAANLDVSSGDMEAMYVHGNGIKLLRFESTDGNAVQLRLQSDSTDNRRILATDSNGTTQRSQISLNNDEILLAGPTVSGGDRWAEIGASGLVVAGGSITVGGTGLAVPDYVFAPDYELMPLRDVEAFVAENSHLPNVPSAAEINSGSMNMTQMQLTLLEKVEELTLYTLQQQDTIDAQQAKIDSLLEHLDATQ